MIMIIVREGATGEIIDVIDYYDDHTKIRRLVEGTEYIIDEVRPGTQGNDDEVDQE